MQRIASPESISIHAPRTGSDHLHSLNRRRPAISIHAPRTGSDGNGRRTLFRVSISIHAPRTGSDEGAKVEKRSDGYFNPRSPHGERRIRPPPPTCKKTISIHAPRTGSDKIVFDAATQRTHFNPRSPHGERHRQHHKTFLSGDFNPRSPHGERRTAIIWENIAFAISIHAPRTGSDIATFFRVESQ